VVHRVSTSLDHSVPDGSANAGCPCPQNGCCPREQGGARVRQPCGGACRRKPRFMSYSGLQGLWELSTSVGASPKSVQPYQSQHWRASKMLGTQSSESLLQSFPVCLPEGKRSCGSITSHRSRARTRRRRRVKATAHARYPPRRKAGHPAAVAWPPPKAISNRPLTHSAWGRGRRFANIPVRPFPATAPSN
jgi:hypothetical protein